MKQKKLSYGELAQFCQVLAMTLHAGVTTGDSLMLMSEDEKDRTMREMLGKIGRGADEGRTLSAVMAEAGCFPDYASGLVEVGERTGKLEEALTALGRYYEQREQMDWRIRNALTYPVILLLMMLTVIVVLLTKVLPIFDRVYASLGGQLKGVAAGLLSLGQWLNRIMPVLLVVLVLAVAAILVFSLSSRVREAVLRLWRRSRGDKGLVRCQAEARFAQALAMGLSSGMPLDEAMILAASLLEDTPAAAGRCRNCIERLSRGDGLADALRESCVLPAKLCRLLTMGVRGGSGDVAMAEIARRLLEEADRTLESRVSRVEPALVIATSLLVGAILLAVMLPLVHIMSAIG